MVFRLFKNGPKTWPEFSSTKHTDKNTKDTDKKDDPGAWMNLEGIHNNIHVCDQNLEIFQQLTSRRIGWEDSCLIVPGNPK